MRSPKSLLSILSLLYIIYNGQYTVSAVDSVQDGYELETSMLNYTDNGNYTYHPSWFVKALHHMPHLNEYAINDRKAQFHGGDNAEVDTYYMSIIGFPILLGILSLIPVVVLQLFSMEISIRLGNDVDMPRNLAKSVTVE